MESPNEASAFDLDKAKQSHLTRAKIEGWLIFSALILNAAFTAADLVDDFGEGASSLHLCAEVLVALLSTFAAYVLWKRTLSLRGEILDVRQDAALAHTRTQAAIAAGEKWQREAAAIIRGLSEAIDAQLTRWQLSNAEKEVALLLLKGLSLKEIADIRGVTEKTARAQSFAVYSKSGLSGRAELSAFFLEDLLLPLDSR